MTENASDPAAEDFVQYYDSIMPMLKQFVMTATSKKAIDCLAFGPFHVHFHPFSSNLDDFQAFAFS